MILIHYYGLKPDFSKLVYPRLFRVVEYKIHFLERTFLYFDIHIFPVDIFPYLTYSHLYFPAQRKAVKAEKKSKGVYHTTNLCQFNKTIVMSLTERVRLEI